MLQTPKDISSADIAKALAIYVSMVGESSSTCSLPPSIDESAPIDVTLASFNDETGRAGTEWACPRYVLRLGNERYPHMKFVIERAMHSDDFYFSVDTHDQANVSELALGKEKWRELQDFNREKKLSIEHAWYKAGLPTLKTIKQRTRLTTASIKARKSQILIVDDEPEAAQLLGIALAREGYKVTTACGGKEALEKVEHERPDLVLLDYMMPEMSGREVCQILKENQQTNTIPVMIATYAEIDAQSFKLADDVLKKPFNSRELIARVGSILNDDDHDSPSQNA